MSAAVHQMIFFNDELVFLIYSIVIRFERSSKKRIVELNLAFLKNMNLKLQTKSIRMDFKLDEFFEANYIVL